MSDVTYPKTAPLGWPHNVDDYHNGAFVRHAKYMGPTGYIDYLRAEGREDDVPCLDCGLVGGHRCEAFAVWRADELARQALQGVKDELERNEPGPDTWRSVADELPENARIVRAWIDLDPLGTEFFSYYSTHQQGKPERRWIDFMDDDGQYSVEELALVTHWRPLATGPDA